ncbi:MAG TPA: pitrilysin family protein [Terriglobales bacterium]|nr:pitrilysin family protein [Terriglobales bacterium]
MKRTSLLSVSQIVLSFVVIAISIPQLTAQTSWQQIPIPQLKPFHAPEPKRIEFPNGMIIFLQEDHELPLIDGTARIHGGSREEPANKAGLVDIYGEVWRTGGTKTQTGDQLDDFLEARAAKVETDGSADSTTISLSCLKDDFDNVFKVFNELLRQPEFRADKVDLAQKEAFDAISRRNDDAAGIASREAAKLAFGSNNPYTRVPEYATVAAVTQQDLINWHHTFVHPNNIVLGFVGDFDSAAMEAKLRKAFGEWAKGPQWKKPDIKFDPAKPGYYLVPKEDVNQSSIRMVALGATKDNPDFYAIEVFNEAFGGGFASRLFRNIRTAQGLAYSVGGGIGTGFDHPGMQRLSMGTKSTTTVESIQALYTQIDDLQKDPISEDEIKRAKDTILNSFVFNLDTPQKVLSERMRYQFYGYPLDFLERYRAGIEKVGPADVARVAAKYVHKDQLKVLVVGNTAEFDKPLDSLGPVKTVDISIPPPPAEGQEPVGASEKKPTASNPEGKVLAAKVVDAMGGLAKLKSIKAMKADITSTEEDGSHTPIQVTIAFPDSMRADVQTPNGKLVMAVSPAVGFMSAEGMGVRDLPASQKSEYMAQIHRDPIYIGQHLDDPEFSFAANGTEKIGNVTAQIVDVAGSGMTIRWFVDPQSGRILQESYDTIGRSGPTRAVTELSDWKTTDGVTSPSVHTNKQDGKTTNVSVFNSVELNPAVDVKLFARPASPAKATQ